MELIDNSSEVERKQLTGSAAVAAVVVARQQSHLLDDGARQLLHVLVDGTRLLVVRLAERLHQHLFFGIVQDGYPPVATLAVTSICFDNMHHVM